MRHLLLSLALAAATTLVACDDQPVVDFEPAEDALRLGLTVEGTTVNLSNTTYDCPLGTSFNAFTGKCESARGTKVTESSGQSPIIPDPMKSLGQLEAMTWLDTDGLIALGNKSTVAWFTPDNAKAALKGEPTVVSASFMLSNDSFDAVKLSSTGGVSFYMSSGARLDGALSSDAFKTGSLK